MTPLETALHWARMGVSVFPCGMNKRPLTSNGFYDATRDEAKIRALFDFNDECLVGGRMGSDCGLFALDFDLYKDASAREYMEFLQKSGALPDSQVHITRSGGVHVLYRSESSWPNCKPVDGVEVKGEGGYIILPDSPGYRVEHEGIVDAPPVLLEILASARRDAKAESTAEYERKVLTGQSFHDPLAVISSRMSTRGEPQHAVFAHLMLLLTNSLASRPEHARHNRWLDLYNDRDGEVSKLAFSGDAKYNPDTKDDAARSSYDPGNFADVSASFFTSGGSKPQINDADDEWAFEGEGFDMLAVNVAEHHHAVVHPFLIQGDTMLLAGHPKTGKSAIALDLAIHLACGVDVSPDIQVPDQRPVLYFALEGVRAVKLRIAAKMKVWEEQGIVPKNPQLFVIEKSKDFFTRERQREVIAQIAAADRQAQKKWGSKIGAVFIDTLTRAMPGGDQNDATATGQFFDTVPLLRDAGLEAAYVVIHHLRKDGVVRGSTNIEAEVDTIAKVTRHDDAGTVSLYIDNARSIEAGDSFYYRMKDIPLGVTPQGYKLSAPVMVPVGEEDAASADNKAKEAALTSKMLVVLLGMNVGKHLLDEVVVAFARGKLLRSKIGEKQAPQEARMLLATALPNGEITYKGRLYRLHRDGTDVIDSLIILPA